MEFKAEELAIINRAFESLINEYDRKGMILLQEDKISLGAIYDLWDRFYPGQKQKNLFDKGEEK